LDVGLSLEKNNKDIGKFFILLLSITIKQINYHRIRDKKLSKYTYSIYQF